MNELITLESKELSGIDQSKAAQIKAVFQPMEVTLFEFEEQFNAIVAESAAGITEDLTKKAKRLRIDIGSVRINTEKTRKDQKEEYLLAGKAIDGVANILKWAVSQKEDKLEAIERHFETLEKQRIESLQTERASELSKYVDDVPSDLGTMKDDVWSAYIEAKKKQHEERIEAERKAEAERAESARLDKLENERHLKILPLRQFWIPAGYNLRGMDEPDFQTVVKFLEESKAEHDKKQAEIAAENERLKKEVEEKERLHKEEEAKRKAKEEETNRIRELAAKKEREEHEEKLKKEREERAKSEQIEREKREAVERELAEKKAEDERLKKEEAARVQAELSKGDSEKVADLKNDLLAIKVKYSFKSEKNKKMYGDVVVLIDKVIAHIGGK